ncbi:hypothetical protein [Planococcus ruber]|uniref:hypothetical protein n=1 Tax=Planococcus ruber TaxID=2027871 RepID=UPI001FEDD74A|nr:hypothetical protein [Planococcus ruber]MCJ1909009.1 hypothetical protein [Planococcus ruber]
MKDIIGVIFVLLSFLGFYLIENVFTIEPQVTSGNGNLGMLIILLLSPIFFVSYFYTFKKTREVFYKVQKKIIKALILSLLLLLIVVLVFLNIEYTNELIIALGGTPSDPDSRIFRFGWFNQYTNSIYFNLYTFLLTHILAVIIGILSAIRNKEKR